MRHSMLRRKSLETLMRDQDGEQALPRVLGPGALICLGVGGIIGTGIFIMTGIAAHDTAGPALVVSFVIAALACIAAALCYAEFAAMVPVAGSAYTYAYFTLGEVFAWIVGWNMVLQYGLAAASVAQGWSHYFQSIVGSFGLKLPALLAGAPVDFNTAQGHFVASGALLDLPALLITAIITLVIVRGIRLSLVFNNAMLLLKLGVILFVILAGAWFIRPHNWVPFAPYGWSGISLFGKTVAGSSGAGGAPVGVLAGAALVFYAYMGFEAITAYTEEARRPQRSVPLSIIASVLICTVLYIAVTVVVTGMTPYNRIDVNAPISDAFRQVGLPWAQFLVAFGATTGITSVLLVILLSYPRILIAIGRDGLISPRFFTALHPRYRTPWKSMIAVGVFVGLLASLVPLRILAGLVIMGTLFGYVLISAAVLVMRRKYAESQRPFRAPFGPLVPLLSMVACGGLMLALPPINWMHLLIWLLLGVAVYLLYGRRQSALLPSAVVTTEEPVATTEEAVSIT